MYLCIQIDIRMAYYIAAILTVYNRKQKTLLCLKRLFEAFDAYNERTNINDLQLIVYLTDDNSTDGTTDAIKTTFGNRDVHILQGTGSLFWAGGMRLAWESAIKASVDWDYFLLLNDDTFVKENVFDELFETDRYCLRQYGTRGIISGITCQPDNETVITYGGLNFVSKAKGRQVVVQPKGIPQEIDLVHANILLVHSSIVEKIGIFYIGYCHACADNDYGLMAQHNNIPVLSTSYICGECERNHDSNKGEIVKLRRMTLKERKDYINSPIHSDDDYLLFVRRNIPMRFPFALLARTIRLYLPSAYYYIGKLRGLYK